MKLHTYLNTKKTMKLHTYLMTFCFLAIPWAHSTVIFSENFDSLNAGDLNGQGGWTANVPGAMTVVNDPSVAFSAPNFLTLGGGGAPQHSFSSTDLSLVPTDLSFHFLSNTSTAGRNIQLSMRTSSSGSASYFYLNLLGSGSGFQAGTSSSSFSSYTFSSSLSTNTWYRFRALTNPVSKELTFSVIPASGGSALASGTIDLSATDLTAARIVFSSNLSTVAGEWGIDNVVFAIPEPNSSLLLLTAFAFFAIFLRRSRSRSTSFTTSN